MAYAVFDGNNVCVGLSEVGTVVATAGNVGQRWNGSAWVSSFYPDIGAIGGGSGGANLPALSEFDDRLLLTNIDNMTWEFGGTGDNVTKGLSTEHTGLNNNSIRLSCEAVASQNGFGKAAFPEALNLTDYTYIDVVVWADGRNTASSTWFTVYLFSSAYSSFSNYYSISLSVQKPGWNIIRIEKAAFTGTGSPNWANIVWTQLQVTSATNNIRTLYFSEIYGAKAETNRAVVSLSFDDTTLSQYHAATLAASRGISATFFHIKHLVNAPAKLSILQLQKMREMGHEHGMHGASSGYNNWLEEYNAVGRSAFIAKLEEDLNYLSSLDFGFDPELASFPQGIWSENLELDPYGGPIVSAIRQAGLKYVRTISLHAVNGNRTYAQYSINHPRSGALISAGTSLGSTYTLQQVKDGIDYAIATGSWVNIYGHNLAATSSDSNTIARADYIAILDYLAAKRDAGLLDVRPFGEVARELERNGYLTSGVES